MRFASEPANQTETVVGTIGERLDGLELADLAREFLEVAAEHIRRVNREEIDRASKPARQAVQKVASTEMNVAKREDGAR